jgi:uncharacterized membrane protein YhhN
MFVLVAYSARTGVQGAYYGLIMGGLCASLAGDALLLFTDRGSGFATAGGVAFAGAHLLYIGAFWIIASPSWVDAVFFAILMTLAAALLQGQRLKLGRSPLLVYAYAVLLSAMASKAISMLWAPEVSTGFGVLAAVGGMLFAVSDLLLGVEHQTGSKVAGSVSNLVYYAAQGLIALTVTLAPR